jgi:hypothetical protein
MKKLFLLVILFSVIATLSGCNKNVGEISGVQNIKKEDIFNQKEDEYFVYFHRLDCEDCEASKPYVIEYAQILKDYEGCSGKRKIYSVLLYTSKEKPDEEILIYREYSGEDGQGTDGKFYVDGKTDWKDLYIASTSSLISISTVSGVKKAYYTSQGVEGVKEKLTTQMGNCYLK